MKILLNEKKKKKKVFLHTFQNIALHISWNQKPNSINFEGEGGEGSTCR